jgi:hypothetical protein
VRKATEKAIGDPILNRKYIMKAKNSEETFLRVYGGNGWLLAAVPSYKSLVPHCWLDLLSFLLAIAISVGSFMPGQVKAAVETLPISMITHHRTKSAHRAREGSVAHRACHFCGFGCLAFLLLLMSNDFKSELNVCLGVATFGLLIESLQYLLKFSRVFEWWDVRDDVVSITTAFVLIQTANMLDRRYAAAACKISTN